MKPYEGYDDVYTTVTCLWIWIESWFSRDHVLRAHTPDLSLTLTLTLTVSLVDFDEAMKLKCHVAFSMMMQRMWWDTYLWECTRDKGERKQIYSIQGMSSRQISGDWRLVSDEESGVRLVTSVRLFQALGFGAHLIISLARLVSCRRVCIIILLWYDYSM